MKPSLPVLVALAAIRIALAPGDAASQPARAATVRAAADATAAIVTGPYALLAWNDLGMHCMNKDHVNFSVLPPYNNLFAQVIRRGDALTVPAVVTDEITIEYSIPGNTYSVGKTDFWTYAPALFGVPLPPDVGLTGKGLTGVLDPAVDHFAAIGIPVTPFPDATPTVENAYQQALLIAHRAGAEIGRSAPVIPVSVELGCVGSGCHASETSILQNHPVVSGFDPNATPILCAGCHADPVLGTTGRPEAGYFSMRMHGAHKFMDEQGTGTAVCYGCHPGPNTQCLRGVMADSHGMVCQDCHGDMSVMEASIDGGGRTPWLDEPACRTCHTSRFGEPVGQLYRESTGHGGVRCEGCHHSTHGEWPSRLAADNANAIALQGTAGVLGDCRVCHRVYPAGEGPHGIVVTSVAGEILGGARAMSVHPNPTTGPCDVSFGPAGAERGTLLVFDSQGRTVRLLHARPEGSGMTARWDARDGHGTRVAPGVYFIRWQGASTWCAARVTVVEAR